MTIKEQLIKGFIYTAISKYSGMIISLVVTAVLARIISPSDFGIVAIATVLITFFGIFTDLGIGAGIIQNKGLTKDDYANIFTQTILGGLFITILFVLSSWTIGYYYSNKTLTVICQLLSINLFFASINIVPNALIYKDKEFKFIAWRSLIIQTIGGGASILSALHGAGLYALVINPIFSSIILFIISYRKKPQKICFHINSTSIKKIFVYSTYQFLFNLINYFSRNLDKLAIGKFMGMNQLGYYEKSYRLMMLPLQNITYIIGSVMHPIFSEMQNDKQQLAKSYEDIVKILAYIGFPLSVFLYFAASEITLLFFGNQWINSIEPFKILAVSVGIQVVMSTSGSIFQAANDTKSLFISGLISSIFNVFAIIIGVFVFQSLKAIAWCICTSFTISFIQSYGIMYRITFKRNIRFLYANLINPLLLSSILILAFLIYNSVSYNLSLFISTVIKFGISIFIFCIFIILSNEFGYRNKLIKKLLTKNNT